MKTATLKTLFFLLTLSTSMVNASSLNSDDLFYENVVKNSPNAKPILVKDTDSAIGRFNLYPKKLGMKTLARAHGHLCDGLVLAYVELSHTLPLLFQDGIVDRTDVRVVAKNSPCLVDTSALMSGARINHKTLSLDNSLGGSFIVQRISTGKAYKVSLSDSTFLHALKAQEKMIKTKVKEQRKVLPKDVDRVESLAFGAMECMLKADPKELLKITPLQGYQYHFSLKNIAPRSDTINKNIARKK